MKTLLLILIGDREKTAVQVQKVLTGWGCMIKTRLGIQHGVMENCSDEGLLNLKLYGNRGKMEELVRKVSLIKGVASKLVDISIFDGDKVVKKKIAEEKKLNTRQRNNKAGTWFSGLLKARRTLKFN